MTCPRCKRQLWGASLYCLACGHEWSEDIADERRRQLFERVLSRERPVQPRLMEAKA